MLRSSAAAPARRVRSVGMLVVATFAIVMMLPSLPNPLMPLYVARYDLSPLAQAAVYATYLAAFVIVMLILSTRTLPVRTLTALLFVGIVVGIAADLASAPAGSLFAPMFAGRVLTGVSGGLATAAASALALILLGVRARTMVGTGAVLGSLLGNLAAGVVGTVLPLPTVSTYLLHAVILTAALVVLAVALRPALRAVPPPVVRTETDAPGSPITRRHRLAGYLLGGGAWAIAGMLVSLLPSALGTAGTVSPLLAAVPPCVMFAVAFLAQRAVQPVMRSLRAWHLFPAMVVGFVLLAAGLRTDSWPLILASVVVLGAAEGPAYSLGLATVTYGLPPGRHARITSGYSAIAYVSCALGSLGVGAMASVVGMPTALLLTAGCFVVLGAVAIVSAGRPQDLRAVT
ncbi:hypothetical protein ACTU3I_05635 [Microbacterium sp. RD1]|uniref:hypothetical protein n=1 Tax=Microbacterium sp. RD1 TaxID=3457313 RepID=UPI003FA5B03F